MSQAMIPFLDLVTPHVEMEEELVEIFRDCIRKAHFIGGSMLEEFERDFAQFCESKYCVGVANGTDAVRFVSELKTVTAHWFSEEEAREAKVVNTWDGMISMPDKK